MKKTKIENIILPLQSKRRIINDLWKGKIECICWWCWNKYIQHKSNICSWKSNSCKSCSSIIRWWVCDEVWKVYWYLEVISVNWIIKWLSTVNVKCVCWKQFIVNTNSLRTWNSKSCWCMKYKIAAEKNTKHWLSWTRFKSIYYNMKARCERWEYTQKWILCLWKTLNDFKKDMYDDYIEHVNIYWESQTSIDRIDWKWNYCKDNCRWATIYVQSRNKDSYEWITFIERCEKLWINYKTFHTRRSRWWTIREALLLDKRNEK